MRKITYQIPRSDRDILGDNNADNDFVSSAVLANEDGSIIERLQWVQDTLGGAAIQLRTEQSASTTVEETGIMQFSISLIDIDSGAVASANIDITSISQVMQRSRGGAAFSTISDPVVSFSKDTGRVYMDYEFKAAQWQVGDIYKMAVSGITCTIGGDTAYVPAMVWSNMVTESANIDTNVEAILVDTAPLWDTTLTGASVVSGSMASFISTGGTALGTVLPASTSLYDTVKNLNTVGITSAPVEKTLSDILHKDGSFTFDNTTDSLEAIADKITSGVASNRIAATTIDLNQAASTYTLFTGSTGAVLLDSIIFALPNIDVSDDATITYITIQTDHTTPQVIFNSTYGAKANLTAENQLSWRGQPIYIGVGDLIRLTIAGGAADVATVCNVVAEYRAIVAGGSLA